jgi:hypothetical protein
MIFCPVNPFPGGSRNIRLLTCNRISRAVTKIVAMRSKIPTLLSIEAMVIQSDGGGAATSDVLLHRPYDLAESSVTT